MSYRQSAPTGKTHKGADGMCLAELLIATTAGIVVMSAALQSFEHFQKRLWGQMETMDQQQELRIGLKIFLDELRLAGSGAPPMSAALTKADRDEVEFLANLDGLVTALAQPVSATEKTLMVTDGTDWPKGKQLWVCDEEQCRGGKLAGTGQTHLLTLVNPVGLAFPPGRPVFVSNSVRYYLGKNRLGTASLMREVDNGANALISGITSFRLHYSDRQGHATEQLEQIARVQIELSIAHGPIIRTEVGLRGRI